LHGTGDRRDVLNRQAPKKTGIEGGKGAGKDAGEKVSKNQAPQAKRPGSMPKKRYQKTRPRKRKAGRNTGLRKPEGPEDAEGYRRQK